MPPWLISLAATLAIKFGIPWVIKMWPGIPQQVIDIINELLGKLKNPAESNSAAKKLAIVKIKECTGTGCPPKLVS